MPLELTTRDQFKIQAKSYYDGLTHLKINCGETQADIDITLTESEVEDLIHMLRNAS